MGQGETGKGREAKRGKREERSFSLLKGQIKHNLQNVSGLLDPNRDLCTMQANFSKKYVRPTITKMHHSETLPASKDLPRFWQIGTKKSREVPVCCYLRMEKVSNAEERKRKLSFQLQTF